MNTIRSRLIWAFLSVIIALLASSLIFFGISVWEVRQYRSISDTMIIQHRLIENAENLINSYNKRVQSAGIESRGSRKEFDDIKKEIKTLTVTLDNTDLNLESRSNYLGLKASMEDFTNHIDNSIKRFEEGNIEDYFSDYNEANKKFEFVRDNGTTLIFSQLKYSYSIRERIDQVYRIGSILTLSWLVLSAIACIIFILRFSKRLTKPLANLTYASQQLANENLDFRIDKKILQEKSELGILANSFNTMTIKLKDKISQLNSIQAEQAKQISEAERMNKLMIGRELKMIELKKEIEELKKGKINEENK